MWLGSSGFWSAERPTRQLAIGPHSGLAILEGPVIAQLKYLHSWSRQGINTTRSARVPAYFREVGDILATPELTALSPWLDLSSEVSRWYSLTDEAYEKIPEQLLPRLRPDPILSLLRTNGQIHARASVLAGYSYALETSTDLQHWTNSATHFADSGTLDFPEPLAPGAREAFYRLQLIDPAPSY